MKFLDQAKIWVQSGHGGPGCVSFRREAFVEFGGPDGGDGGRGGDVVVECVDGLNTLIDFRYQQHFKAEAGRPGSGRNRSGPRGADCVIRVPAGTQILDDDRETVLFDLTEIGQRVVLAKGGDGGFGNVHYKSSTNRAPRKSTPGWPGEERWVWLRLKLIADVGIVGLPNAGKSTFLAAVSAARPKVADYPFTTLHPGLGVVRRDGEDMVIADLPGLIEGAAEGAGLGHRFLGHVERCGAVLHLIDGTEEDPATAYRTVRAELKAYGHDLTRKPEVVALNKVDALDPETRKMRRAALAKAARRKPLLCSGVSGEGVEEVLKALLGHVQKARAARRAEAEARQEAAGEATTWRP